ncbi:Copia protein, partial [Mucuna pruriens]
MNMRRVIISLAAHFGWNLEQFDVKNVFLYGDLEEEVYMEIPQDSILIMKRTRPDITYVVNVANPRKGLLFKKEGTLSMEIYPDADYAKSVVDKRSTFGYCMFLGGNLVTLRSNKLNVVVRSSAEAEFRAMSQGICEGLWMKIILDNLKIKYEGPIKLFL